LASGEKGSQMPTAMTSNVVNVHRLARPALEKRDALGTDDMDDQGFG